MDFVENGTYGKEYESVHKVVIGVMINNISKIIPVESIGSFYSDNNN